MEICRANPIRYLRKIMYLQELWQNSRFRDAHEGREGGVVGGFVPQKDRERGTGTRERGRERRTESRFPGPHSRFPSGGFVPQVGGLPVRPGGGAVYNGREGRPRPRRESIGRGG
jgi:hypothetical protein